MPGLGGEVLKSFGTNVVLLPGPDVVPAITSEQLMELNGSVQLLILEKVYIKFVNITIILDGMSLEPVLEAFINLQKLGII